MLLISPDFLEIGMSATLPPHLEGFKISNSKILYGSTPKGTYLFQDLFCFSYHACFINLFSLEKHKILMTNKTASFFIMVQLKNSLECEFYNCTSSLFYEWSINLFYSKNVYADITLHKDKDYSTFILFIPNDVIKKLCKGYPIIERFHAAQGNEATNKLFKGNPICSFKIMDLIKSFYRYDNINARKYIEIIKETFEHLSKKKLHKQSYVEEKFLDKVYSLTNYIENNTTENFTRTALSKRFNISLYHFEKAFSKIYNASPMLLLRYFRMSESKNEIDNHNTGLIELAFKYHYTYNSFFRAFQSIYKMHPTIHRQKVMKRASSKRFNREIKNRNNPKRGK